MQLLGQYWPIVENNALLACVPSLPWPGGACLAWGQNGRRGPTKLHDRLLRTGCKGQAGHNRLEKVKGGQRANGCDSGQPNIIQQAVGYENFFRPECKYFSSYESIPQYMLQH